MGFPLWDPREDIFTRPMWAVLMFPNSCIHLPSRPCPESHTVQRSREWVLSVGLFRRREVEAKLDFLNNSCRIYQIAYSTFPEIKWEGAQERPRALLQWSSLHLETWCPGWGTPLHPWNPTSTQHYASCTIYLGHINWTLDDQMEVRIPPSQ